MIESIAVIGLGFVGLTTALGFAEKGFRVRGFDRDPERTALLAAGHLPFHEPGLDGALAAHLGDRFRLASDIADALDGASLVFLCVGTPCSPDGTADLTMLLAVTTEVIAAAQCDKPTVLVIKSTVPPGTTRDVVAPLLSSRASATSRQPRLATNPEFLREGYAWDDFLRPDRIVVGVDDEVSAAMLAAAYRDFAAPVQQVTQTEAEFIKYLSNTLLATMISFANEMAMIGERIGDIDIARAFRVLHQDKRWHGTPAAMASYVYPGCGFGGYCLPKDTQAMAQLARRLGVDAGILDSVLATNRAIKHSTVARIAATVHPEQTIGILGLSFKPESDDVRESPSRDIIDGLLGKGFHHIVAHDPMAADNFAAAYNLPLRYAQTAEELVSTADIVVVATAWREYVQLLSKPATIGKPVIDLRYCLDPQPPATEETNP